MTDVDERLLTAAKLAEQSRGDLETSLPMHPHTGVVSDPDVRRTLSFLASVDDWRDSELRSAAESTLITEELTDAVLEGNASKLANAVGVTESELTASEVRLLARLSKEIENHGAPAFTSVAGNPNTGKTNTAWLLVELRKEIVDDLLVVSNAAGSLTDVRVASMHELAEALIRFRDRPKAVVLDECSTHMDARTYRREVALQFTPVAKRMAKIGVDSCTFITHTGKDLHPEAKRLTTLAAWKETKTDAEFFGSWPSDSEAPADPLFSGPVGDVEPTAVEYDPNDTAPWAWDLEADLFQEDRDWPGYLELLRERGPDPDA